MLIRTIDELEAAHKHHGAVILDKDGAPIWESGTTFFEEEGKSESTWLVPFIGLETSREIMRRGPFTLICPRRYGDEDVERVAEIMKQHAPRYGSYHLAGCMCGDNLNHKDFRVHVARAALDALETGNIPPEEATAATMAGKNNTNQQNTAEEGNYDH